VDETTPEQRMLREQLTNKKALFREFQKDKKYSKEVVDATLSDLMDIALRLELSKPAYRGLTPKQAHKKLHSEKITPVMVTQPICPTAAMVLDLLGTDSQKLLAAMPDLTRFMEQFRQGGSVALDCVALLQGSETITKPEADALRELLGRTEEVETGKTVESAPFFKAFSGIAGPNEIPVDTIAIYLK
jgi:hypothetical protein